MRPKELGESVFKFRTIPNNLKLVYVQAQLGLCVMHRHLKA